MKPTACLVEPAHPWVLHPMLICHWIACDITVFEPEWK